MCVRITRELRKVYEKANQSVDSRLEIGHLKLFLRDLGYLTFTEEHERLVLLAFKTIEVDGTFSFENLAMFINLINNVFIN